MRAIKKYTTLIGTHLKNKGYKLVYISIYCAVYPSSLLFVYAKHISISNILMETMLSGIDS